MGSDDQSGDLITWYFARPLWVRILLGPLYLPFFIAQFASNCIVLLIVMFVLVPAIAIQELWTDYRFRRKMRRAARILTWAEIEPLLIAERGALLVEVSHKGVRYGWWIDGYQPDGFPPRFATFHWSTSSLPLYRDEVYLAWHLHMIERYRESANVLLELPTKELIAERTPADRVLVVLGSFQR